MALRETLDEIAVDAETRVLGLFERRRAGQVDEERFVSMSAATINQANGKATVTADVAVSVEVATRKGGRPRLAGIHPFDDQARLKGAVRATATEGKTPAEAEATRRMKLGRLARSEPYSTAQDTMPKAMEAHGARGWVRVANTGACKLCRKWADGKVRPLTMMMIRHPGCTCLQRPVFTEAKAKADVTVDGKLVAKFGASFVDEAVITLLAGGGTAGYIHHRQRPPHWGPTIFDRMAQLEANLHPHGIELRQGQYMIHGSGLLDALNIRAAGDLDVIAHPDLYDLIAGAPGWRRLMAGVEKDVEILSNPKLNMQIAKAVEETPTWRRQITITDLETNTVTLKGREFIKPDLLAEMKAAAIREGAKVPKNIRDINLLDGRLTWDEDVLRFGNLLNRSRLGGPELRGIAATRHPSATVSAAQAARRAAATMRVHAAKRGLKPIATVLERRALQRYGSGSFGLNQRLRSGTPLSGYEQKLVALIDAALAKQHTPYRVKVYRGLRMSRAEALELYGEHIGGPAIREKSYMSTGLRETVARKYGQSGVFLELDVPAGTNGYYAPYRALTSPKLPDKFLQAIGEDELLLPRGLPYRVKEIVRRPDGTILVKAEVVPPA